MVLQSQNISDILSCLKQHRIIDFRQSIEHAHLDLTAIEHAHLELAAIKRIEETGKTTGRPIKDVSPMSVRLHLLVNPERDERYREAAESAGMDLSAWIRRACDAAAAEQLGDGD